MVEIVIVVALLGVLSSITAYAVTGFSRDGEAVAEASDEDVLVTAQQAYFAQHGRYTTEDVLVATGLLRSDSRNHDIVVAADGSTFTIIPQVTAPSSP